jgi:hypothetical protein
MLCISLLISVKKKRKKEKKRKEKDLSEAVMFSNVNRFLFFSIKAGWII